MVAPPETYEFSRHQPDQIVARMADLAEGHAGWINLRPDVGDDEDAAGPPTRPGLFSGVGPAVPLCTWTPGERRRRGTEPPSIGLQHQGGPKVAQRLARLGHEVPSEWVVLQDHSRRGLVVAVPPDAPHAAVLDWLLVAGELLCVIPTTDRWTAAVFGASD